MNSLLQKTFLICALFFSAPLWGQQFYRYTTEINTPTAFTIPRGTYQLGLLAYDEGGLEFKTVIGLNDIFYIGGSFDMAHAVGKEAISPHIPGLIAKIKFTDGPETFPISIAIGYDSFYMGATEEETVVTTSDSTSTSFVDETVTETVNVPLNRMAYGPYFVITKPTYVLDEEQHFNFGMRVPTQPYYDPQDASYFLSLDVPLGQYFVVKSETERIYWNFARSDQWLLNCGFRYNIFAKVGIELDIMFQHNEIPNRIVRVEYSDSF